MNALSPIFAISWFIDKVMIVNNRTISSNSFNVSYRMALCNQYFSKGPIGLDHPSLNVGNK